MTSARSGQRIPGSLFISDARDDLNRAYRHLTRDFVSSSPFIPASVDGALAGSPAPTSQEWTFKIDVCQSMRELMTSLDVRVSAEASLWGGTVSGMASWVRNIAFKAETLVVVVSVRNVLSISPYDGSKLHMVDEAKKLMVAADAASFARFYNKFGSYFVGKRWRGGELNIVLRRDFASRKEKDTAAATARAAGMSWSADAKATKEKVSSLDKLNLKIEGHGVGGRLADFPADAGAVAVLDWVFKSWIPSLDDGTAGTLQLELMDLSTCNDGNPDFGKFLAGPHANYEALVDILLKLDALAARIDYLQRDPEHCAPLAQQRGRLRTLSDEVGASRQGLVRKASDGLELAPPQESVHDDTLRAWNERIGTLEQELGLRRPILHGERFRLRTTGENDMYLAGPYQNMGPRMDKSPARAEPLQFDGADATIGADVRLHSQVGIGTRHIITAMGRNDWLQYKSGTDDAHTWRIEGKRNGGDAYIRSGDRIRITNKKYQDMTIKAAEKDGIYWAKAKPFRNHWLLIERWEAPPAAMNEEDAVPDE